LPIAAAGCGAGELAMPTMHGLYAAGAGGVHGLGLQQVQRLRAQPARLSTASAIAARVVRTVRPPIVSFGAIPVS
jgi:hypothetical protein